jgi:hypothetical protein
MRAVVGRELEEADKPLKHAEFNTVQLSIIIYAFDFLRRNIVVFCLIFPNCKILINFIHLVLLNYELFFKIQKSVPTV